MQKVTLNAVIKKEWQVHISLFSPNEDSRSDFTITVDPDTPLHTIHEKVLKEEEKTAGKYRIYYYWVSEVEIMEDDRFEKYGHAIGPSQKVLRENIHGYVYTQGVRMTVGEVLKQAKNEQTSMRFNIFLILNFDRINNLTEKELKTSVVMIPGDISQGNFFEILNERDLMLNSFAGDTFVV